MNHLLYPAVCCCIEPITVHIIKVSYALMKVQESALQLLPYRVSNLTPGIGSDHSTA
jgi:hypothetical protein